MISDLKSDSDYRMSLREIFKSKSKPCPFCGSEGQYAYNDVYMSKWKHRIECTSMECRIEGPLAATPTEALEVWNTRIRQE